MLKNYQVNNYELDKYQLEVLNNDTNILINAGAGSGKTLTLLGKINYLLECNIKNDEILVISFTNNSVNDIKNKINKNIDVFTFHKLAINILDSLNINYRIEKEHTLEYTINEYLYTCNKNEQKDILNYLGSITKYKYFLNSKYFNSFKNFIFKFINLYKCNDIKNINKYKLTNKEKKIITIILNIYNKYIEEKNSTNTYDFDDLIIIATKYIYKTNLKYKYIIIDEFQDTSMIRFNLIKEIIKYTNSKLIVVGDDYQSIYHFSGCDLKIFIDFKKHINNVKEITLHNTYRNSLELINIASKFILKNKLQIKKDLYSNKSNNKPIVFVPYKNNNILKKLLDYFINNNKKVMILIRNNFDIYTYIVKDMEYINNIIIYKNNEFKVYTIHKSKGLEEDNVIILNCNNDIFGIPNKLEENNIINKFFSSNEICYAEERRIFYVGITRCKESTYLVYSKNKPSMFIKEIKKIIKKLNYNIQYFK